jgi:hypothetical protein
LGEVEKRRSMLLKVQGYKEKTQQKHIGAKSAGFRTEKR